MMRFLGIARERVYSPGKVDDDRAILEEVAERLRRRHEVTTVSADDPLPEPDPGTLVFTMAQGPAALAAMYRWQQRGVRLVNSPQSIENCHRRRMLAAFEQHGVKHPPSTLIDTAAPHWPAWLDGAPAWLKRGDVHATEPDDVVRLESAAQLAAACARFARRGITTALLQAHVEGTVVKFYAVPGKFFEAFRESPPAPLSDDSRPASLCAGKSPPAPLFQRGENGDGGGPEKTPPYLGPELSSRGGPEKTPPEFRPELSSRGGPEKTPPFEKGGPGGIRTALGLEIYGGDYVHTPDGEVWLIDVNDWPSYGRCRSRAADAIAEHLERQAHNGAPV